MNGKGKGVCENATADPSTFEHADDSSQQMFVVFIATSGFTNQYSSASYQDKCLPPGVA